MRFFLIKTMYATGKVGHFNYKKLGGFVVSLGETVFSEYLMSATNQVYFVKNLNLNVLSNSHLPAEDDEGKD